MKGEDSVPGRKVRATDTNVKNETNAGVQQLCSTARITPHSDEAQGFFNTDARVGAASGAEGRPSSPNKPEGSASLRSAGCHRLPQTQLSNLRALPPWNPARAPARSRTCRLPAGQPPLPPGRSHNWTPAARPPLSGGCAHVRSARRTGTPGDPARLQARGGGAPGDAPTGFREGLRGRRARPRQLYPRPARASRRPAHRACAPHALRLHSPFAAR